MKKSVGFIIAAVLMFMHTEILSAAVRSFTMSASVPAATGVSLGVSSVTGSGTASLPSTATTLSFNSMAYDATNGFWEPNNTFVLDVAPSGGSGSVTTVVTYTEGTNQNNTTGGHGLGHKATATFMKTTGSGSATTDTLIAAHGKKRLIDLTGGETVTPAEVAGGWLRVYMGIVTDPSVVSGSEIFSNADHSGQYDGTVTVTTTAS